MRISGLRGSGIYRQPGENDPTYDGLGGRYTLYYIEENELVY
jgi:hypothetical protein